jgi:hypothetical protein
MLDRPETRAFRPYLSLTNGRAAIRRVTGSSPGGGAGCHSEAARGNDRSEWFDARKRFDEVNGAVPRACYVRGVWMPPKSSSRRVG